MPVDRLDTVGLVARCSSSTSLNSLYRTDYPVVRCRSTVYPFQKGLQRVAGFCLRLDRLVPHLPGVTSVGSGGGGGGGGW